MLSRDRDMKAGDLISAFKEIVMTETLITTRIEITENDNGKQELIIFAKDTIADEEIYSSVAFEVGKPIAYAEETLKLLVHALQVLQFGKQDKNSLPNNINRVD